MADLAEAVEEQISLADFDETSGEFQEVVPEEPVDIVQALFEIVSEKNLVSMLEESRLTEIAETVLIELQIDEASRDDWMEKAKRGIELASLMKKGKSYPWPGSANVRIPLIASAAMQFNARANPAILPSDDIVKVPKRGKDPEGKKAAKAERVASYTSHYLRNKMREWEDETDTLTLVLPIVGHMFRKVWYDVAKRRCCSRLLGPESVIVNMGTKSIYEAPRITEPLFLYPNAIKERERAGLFVEMDYTGYQGEYDDEMAVGGGYSVNDDTQAPQKFYEQHTFLDLDDDGYSEPYIVTVHEQSRKIVRIVANYLPRDVLFSSGETLEEVLMQREEDKRITQAAAQMGMGGERAFQTKEEESHEISSIEPMQYYVSYKFLPSMDGGFYGTGLGYLLNSHCETTNGLINLLMDSGHLASLGGGFIGQGLNMKRKEVRLKPGEYKTLNTSGAAIRDALVPVNFPEPSGVLFQLLGLLIDLGKEISTVNDVMTGDTGGAQMQPTTLLAMIDQRTAVFSAAFKRLHAGLTKEFGLIVKLMHVFPDEKAYQRFHDLGQEEAGQVTMRGDFDPASMDIEPSADPKSVTRPQQMAQAQMLLDMARNGELPKEKVVQRVLEASNIPDVGDLLPSEEEKKMAQQLQEEARALEKADKTADVKKKEAEAAYDAARAQSEGSPEAAKVAELEVQKILAEIERIRVQTEASAQNDSEKMAHERWKVDMSRQQFELELGDRQNEREAKLDAELVKAGKEPGARLNRDAVGELARLLANIEQSAAARDARVVEAVGSLQAKMEDLQETMEAPRDVIYKNGRPVGATIRKTR